MISLTSAVVYAGELTDEHVGRIIRTEPRIRGVLLSVQHGGPFPVPTGLPLPYVATGAHEMPRGFVVQMQVRTGERREPMYCWAVERHPVIIELGHEHVDVGGGYCECGAERCSLPRCDAYCTHPGGWLSAVDLEERRVAGQAAALQAAMTAFPQNFATQWCTLHDVHQDDPDHGYSHRECEKHLRQSTEDENRALLLKRLGLS